MSSERQGVVSAASWETWRTYGLYLSVILLANFIWEVLQLPLYTIWESGSRREIAFAVLHCTAGDLLIAALTLGFAHLALGSNWPSGHFWRVAAGATGLGVAYTAFSEWLNTSVERNWAYSDVMPIVPLAGVEIGLSPLLQWAIIPPLGFVFVRWQQTMAQSRDLT